MTDAIGYVRVSTRDQAESGLGLEAQRAAIRAECARRGWSLTEIYEDAGLSGAREDRPGLEAAIAACARARGTPLIVAKVDRLARSIVGFANTLRQLQAADCPLIALDLGVDTATSTGKMIAQVVAVIAEFERDLICDRTRAALGAKRARGERMGPEPVDDPMVIAQIRGARARGVSYRLIAEQLNAEKRPAPRGGTWGVSSVHAMAKRLGITGAAQDPSTQEEEPCRPT